MIFTEFLDCVKRAGLEGKFQYKEEWFNWKLKKIKFLDENGIEISQGLFEHLYHGYPYKRKRYMKMTQDEFLRRCNIINIHHDKYDKVEYINNKIEVIITCKTHGDFKITPDNYLHGKRCKYCGYENVGKINSLKYNDFVDRANKIFNFKYIYTKVDLEHRDEKGRVCIICTEHGEFWIDPRNHLQGQGCKYCGIISQSQKRSMTTEKFIERANKIFNFKYIYTKTDLANRDEKGRVCVICPEHGEFWIDPRNHLSGKGCKFCGLNLISKKRQMNSEEFIERANKIFNFKYIYTKTDLANRDEKGRVCVICPEHGEFWITPTSHLRGAGCAKCNESHNERKIATLLSISNINFNRYKPFDWLKYKTKQNLDFYLEDYNIGIECQGAQHFKPIKNFGGNEQFDLTIKRDINKFKLCQENGVKLLYLFPKEKVDFSKVNEQYEIYKPNGNIFYSPEELIEYIKSQPKIKNIEE